MSKPGTIILVSDLEAEFSERPSEDCELSTPAELMGVSSPSCETGNLRAAHEIKLWRKLVSYRPKGVFYLVIVV